jgi:hypothetical protein
MISAQKRRPNADRQAGHFPVAGNQDIGQKENLR